MSTRKANDDSHFFFVPQPHQARDHHNTTASSVRQKSDVHLKDLMSRRMVFHCGTIGWST